LSDNQRTVRVHFAGYVDLRVDTAANPVDLAVAAARDIEYELTERWRPEEDPSSRLAGQIDERPLATVRPVLGRNETTEERLSALVTAVKQWTTVDGEWVDIRDRYRDEHGDETVPEVLDKKITEEWFQKFWDAGDEVHTAAALLLSALPPLPQSTT
jgi:hypothetical protein